jgi:toluene monooxygenase system ferredoxin subunit
MAFQRVADLDDLWDGEMAPCTAGGCKILLVRLGDTVCAYEDRCVHLGVALSEGALEDRVITCSAHQYRYDALTGRGINPVSVCLTRFPVRIEGGGVWVDIAAGYREASDEPRG